MDTSKRTLSLPRILVPTSATFLVVIFVLAMGETDPDWSLIAMRALRQTLIATVPITLFELWLSRRKAR